ncbi:RNA polymerase Rpb4 [uncultured archaeon]|nr:RNA polymerase Rpb4 [uncultured archaeon]
MILNSEPLSMAEVIEYAKKDEESDTEIIEFIKKFNKIKAKEAKELKQEIESFGIIKVKPEHIVKIIDILPETAEELNKVFADASLDEDESKKILDAIKKFA